MRRLLGQTGGREGSGKAPPHSVFSLDSPRTARRADSLLPRPAPTASARGGIARRVPTRSAWKRGGRCGCGVHLGCGATAGADERGCTRGFSGGEKERGSRAGRRAPAWLAGRAPNGMSPTASSAEHRTLLGDEMLGRRLWLGAVLGIAFVGSGCVANAVKSCTTSADCPSFAECVEGLCVYDACGAGQPACPAGKTCVDAVCVPADSGSGGGMGGGMGGGIGGGGGAVGGGAGGGGNAVDCVPTLMCADYEECEPTADGGRCVSANLMLTWSNPTDGTTFNMATVSGTVSIARGDGGAVTFTSLPVSGAMGGAFTRAGGAFTGTLLLPGADGDKTFVAGWPDAGVSRTLTIRKDTTPPSVALYVEPAPTRLAHELDLDGTNRWKKSEAALVQTESTEDVPILATDFTTAAVATGTGCARACAATRFCRCFSVDLTQQVLDGGVGVVPVALGPIPDAVGNVSAPVSADVAVTRLKWTRDIGVAPNVPPTAIAITSSGVVVAGTSAGITGNSYRLVAVEPDGILRWEKTSTTASITAGPLAGGQTVYVATSNGVDSAIERLHAVDGGVDMPRCGNLGGGLAFEGDLALAGSGATEVAVGVRNNAPPVLLSATSSCLGGPVMGLSGRPTVVVTGDEALVAGASSAPVFKFSGAATLPTAAGSASTMTLFPSNLFAIGTTLVGGGGPTVGGVFAVVNPVGSSLSGSTTNATAGAPGGPAVVGGTAATPRVFYGDNAGVLRGTPLVGLNPVSFGAGVAAPSVGTTLADRAAVVGAGSWVYVAGNDGVLRAISWGVGGPGGGWQWSGLLPATTRISQLNLDVDRSSTGKRCDAGRPGVLYVSAVQGSNARLYAVLVESQGVDGTAPWPRHQHDPANTGNAQTPLSPWTCP